MEAQTLIESHNAPSDWPKGLLFAFRFAFVYFVLYNLPFPFGWTTQTDSLGDKYDSVWHSVVPWIGQNILHLTSPIVTEDNGSGDTTYYYLMGLCILLLAFAAAVLWWFLDRTARNYQRLHQWLRLYIRLTVGAALVMYGATKVFQSQFPPPNLTKLLQPYSEATPMGLLWTFMGVSRGYNLFAGFAEILAGVLLFVPRVTTIAALIGVGVMANTFALNMCYDVPVKIYSFHLLVMCLFLVLPDVPRLINLLLLNRKVEPAIYPTLFKSNRWNTGILVAQLLFCAFLVTADLSVAHQRTKESPDFARPPLYGIWSVDEFSLDGNLLPPLQTDPIRWQKLVFQYPNSVAVQLMDGSWTGYRKNLDMEKKTLKLDKPGDAKDKAELTFSNPELELLIVEGNAKDNKIRVKFHRVDETKFPLLSSGFHWISEEPDDR